MITDSMTQTPVTHTEDCAILDIADMIRRDGHRLYGATDGIPECAYQASLCGVTASFTRNGDVLALVAHDLRVRVTLTILPVDEADGIARNSDVMTQVETAYQKGCATVLEAWHRHLCAYRRSMRTSHSVAA